MRPVVTEADIPTSGELQVGHGAIVTPSARDLAELRGVNIVELPKGQKPAGPGMDRTIAVGSDHGGFELKQKLLAVFEEQGLAVRDVGVHHGETADYPDIAKQVA